MTGKLQRELLYVVWIILLLAACNGQDTERGITYTPEISPGTSVVTLTAGATETQIIPTAPMLPTSTAVLPITPSPSTTPTSSITVESPHVKRPIIHDQPGDTYETLFSIPAGERGALKYKIPSCCANIEGPDAIAVLSDNSFLISDLLGRRLLKYGREGSLLQTIKLDELGIGFVRDMRVMGDEIFLLETAYQNFRVHRLTLDGELISSEEIPYQFLIDDENPENIDEGGLTGIAIDCTERIILEVFGGSKLFPLSEVQEQNDPSLITQGLLCNGNRFFVSTLGMWKDPQVTAGEMNYQTKLSEGLGGLHFLDIFEDGSVYLIRDDVMPINPIKVDQTVHYIDENGAILGVARVPLSEYYYPVMRNTAVSPSGEVYAILPRPDSLDIIRLNFYRELEPLIPGAVIPQITSSQSTP